MEAGAHNHVKAFSEEVRKGKKKKKVIGLMMALLLALCACATAEEKHSSVHGD